MRKKIHLLSFTMAFSLVSCQESIERRAEREAKEYTEQFCPTPEINSTKTDSVVFYKDTKNYTYYCSFSGVIDNQEFVNANKSKLHSNIYKMLNENPSLKTYKDAGFKFVYIVHSTKDPKKVLYKDVFILK